MSDGIPNRTWKHDGLLERHLIAEETKPGDDVVRLGIHHWLTNDGLGVALNPDQADEIADDLKARAAIARSGGAEA